MPWIRDYQYAFSDSDTTTTPPAFTVSAGDLIIVVGFKDNTGSTWSNSDGSYTERHDVSGGGVGLAVYSKIAAGGETPPTLTASGAAEQIGSLVFVIANVHASTYWTSAVVAQAADVTHTMPSLTTPSDDNLLLWVNVNDGPNSRMPQVPAGVMLLEIPPTTAVQVSPFWSFQKTAGSAATPDVELITADDGYSFVVAVAPPASVEYPPHVALSDPPNTILHPLRSVATSSAYGGGLFDPTGTITAIDGVTAGYAALDTAENAGANPLFDGIWLSSATAASAEQYWIGGWDITPIDLTGSKRVLVHLGVPSAGNLFGLKSLVDGGAVIGFRFGTGNYRLFRVAAFDTVPTLRGVHAIVIDIADTGFRLGSDFGTYDITNVDGIVLAGYKRSASSFFLRLVMSALQTITAVKLAGGSAANPMTWRAAVDAIAASDSKAIVNQGGASDRQFYSLQAIQIGDGTMPVYFADPNTSLEFSVSKGVDPRNLQFGVDPLGLKLTLYGLSGDIIDMSNIVVSGVSEWQYIIHASWNAAASCLASGHVIINAEVTLRSAFAPGAGGTFLDCEEITHNGADLSAGWTLDGSWITLSGASEAALQTLLDGFANCTLQNNATALTIEYTGGAADIELSASNITFTSNTVDVLYTSTNASELTIINADGSNITTTDTGGAATGVVVQDPPSGITFTGLVAGSRVQVFEDGTTTKLFEDTNSSASEAWEAQGDQGTVQYVIQKVGYLPIRETIEVGTSSLTLAINQETDRAYATSSGLTYTTDTTYTPGTGTFTLTAATTLQNMYSFYIEEFITRAAFENVQFPILAFGPNSFSFVDGAEFNADSAIDYLSRDGLRYVAADGSTAAIWCAVQGLATADMSAFTAEYQRVAGSGTTDAKAAGKIDQLVKIYGDATHGNFDYTGHLVVKYQQNGYREVRVDVVAQNDGNDLEDQLYVISIEPTALAAATGDPAISITVTDHGASPVTWNSKDFSITITDGGSNSAEAILRELNYNLSLDATYQGQDPFNWPEMVIEAGAGWETARGTVEGGAGAALKGVRVLRGGSAHPDFTRFQADDGTYYAPPTTAGVSIAALVAGWVELYNVTQAALIESVATTSGYSKTWIDGTDADAGDTLRVRWIAPGYLELEASFVATADTTVALLDEPEEDTVYTGYGIDGSSVTEFALDSGNVQIDVDDPDGVFYVARMYAWYKYAMTSAAGIAFFWRAVTAVNASNIRINSDIIDAYVDNASATSCKQGDNIVLFRSDGEYPQATPTSGGGGIGLYYAGVGYTVETGVSGLTGPESAQLMGLPSATVIREEIDDNSTVLAEIETKVTELHKRNDLDGTAENTYADDGSEISNSDFTLTKTDNGNGTFTVVRT
jgi:hypothetical protein